MLRSLLLVCLATAVLCGCPWSYYSISKKINDIPECDAGLSIELSSQNADYTQIAYDVSNVNLTTPFNLSTINITRDGVSKLYVAESFHIHHISKHVIHGKVHDLELHIVHHNKEDDSFIVYAAFIDTHPGDFPDRFNHWVLDTPVPVQQKFPIKLSTPSKALYYEDDPECNENYKTAFYIDTKIYRMKESTFERIVKLIDATETPGLGVPVSVSKDQACMLKKNSMRRQSNPKHYLSLTIQE